MSDQRPRGRLDGITYVRSPDDLQKTGLLDWPLRLIFLAVGLIAAWLYVRGPSGAFLWTRIFVATALAGLTYWVIPRDTVFGGVSGGSRWLYKLVAVVLMAVLYFIALSILSPSGPATQAATAPAGTPPAAAAAEEAEPCGPEAPSPSAENKVTCGVTPLDPNDAQCKAAAKHEGVCQVLLIRFDKSLYGQRVNATLPSGVINLAHVATPTINWSKADTTGELHVKLKSKPGQHAFRLRFGPEQPLIAYAT